MSSTGDMGMFELPLSNNGALIKKYFKPPQAEGRDKRIWGVL